MNNGFENLKEEEFNTETSVQDEVDCSSFVKNIEELKKNFIFEDSTEFENHVVNNGFENLKEEAIVFPKVQKTPNQSFCEKKV